MSRSLIPRARQDDLVIQSAADELLVYDNVSDKAYVLSPSAAAVWRASNGGRTVSEIATYLSNGTPTDERTVWYALGQLQPLLQEPVTLPQDLRGISRRQFLQRAGLVAVAAAVPVVVSIVAPQPVHAQSATFFCCTCTNSALPMTSCDGCSAFCLSSSGLPEVACPESPCED